MTTNFMLIKLYTPKFIVKSSTQLDKISVPWKHICSISIFQNCAFQRSASFPSVLNHVPGIAFVGFGEVCASDRVGVLVQAAQLPE